jgi:hypothetical protein
MIQWYKEGKLPINKIVRSYPVGQVLKSYFLLAKRFQVNDFELAMSDMTSGITVKPILIW